MTTALPRPEMEDAILCDRLSHLLMEQAGELTARWAELLSEGVKVALSPYPTPDDPQLVRGIANCLAGAQPRMICTMELIQRARALGEAAESRDISPDLVLDGCNALNEILWDVAGDLLAVADEEDSRSVSGCVRRLHEAMIVVIRGVTDAYFRAHQERKARNEARLKSFNHTVGHELKNPIASIHGAASLLLEDHVGTDPQRRVHYVSMVKRNAERASALVTDLLALTTGEEIDPGSALNAASIGEIGNRVRERLLDEAELSGLRIEIQDPLPVTTVDPRALDLVLSNLVLNAIRYRDPEKTDRYVRIAAREADESGLGVVCVEDNGIGIPADARERVFDRFYRADAVRTIPGSGLGLSIVRQTVTGWKGSVGFDSTAGAGTSFWFTLPTVAINGTPETSLPHVFPHSGGVMTVSEVEVLL